MAYLAATDSEADVIASGLFLSSFAAVEITTAAAVAANLFVVGLLLLAAAFISIISILNIIFELLTLNNDNLFYQI